MNRHPNLINKIKATAKHLFTDTLVSLSYFAAIAALVFMPFPVWAIDTNTLPTGGQIVAGSGSIAQSGSALTVNQQTDKIVANWNTFNIGRNASVTFQQPGASSVALNRILDQNPSQIFGSLRANGQVFLVNPAGIYFGSTATVDVGGLVASSLNISNENFLGGKYLFEKAGTTGSILNQGSIRTMDGGYIAFISPAITNEGTLTATGGTVALAAGDKVSLDFTGDKLVSFTVDKGSVDALIENKGLIQADGGAVLLTAKAANSLTNAVVNNSGIIEARTLTGKSGRILLLSDMEAGEVIVGGTLDASAPDGGNGGFIETSAAKVTIKDDVHITTTAPNGTMGTWLIDPYDFTIAASGGDVTGATLTAALAGTDVTIQTLAGSVSCTGVACGTGTAAGNGDIFVNDNITWSSHKLTLNAYRNITINKELFGSGTAQLALYYGQGAADGVISGTTATYSVNAPVNLAAGNNFFTQLGSNTANLKTYTVITSLGSAGSTTATDLQGINGGLAGYYVLGANIDATATSGWNSGAGFSPIGTFTGAFDGLGHTISNLYINRPATAAAGLFGYVNGGSISNVGLTDVSITGSDNVGGLAGVNDGGITNSYVTGNVSGTSYAVGGLVGWNFGTVTNSYATANVTGTSDYVGGLVGMNDGGGSITNSYATGNVSGTSNYVGGLVGRNSATITNSYSTGNVSGNVSGTSEFVGGLVGCNDNGGSITDSYATGNVTGNSNYVGGLVGFNDSTITGSYATGAVSGAGNVGGLVGGNTGTVSNSFWDTETSGQATSAGGTGKTTAELMTQTTYTDAGWDFLNTCYMIEGETRPFLRSEYSTTIANAHQLQLIGMNATTLAANYTLANNINMTELMTQASGHWKIAAGFVPVGGDAATPFTGSFDGRGHTITGLYIDRTATDYVGLFGYTAFGSSVRNVGLTDVLINGSSFVGGLVGQNIGTIANSYVTGNVSGNTDVGGLVGSNNGSITNSYATGAVSGTTYVGGLVGENGSGGSITDSYATDTGDVSGNEWIGGLVGDNNGSITNSYATGAVSGTKYVGGLVGGNGFGGSITDSYAMGVVSGTLDYVGGLVGYNNNGSLIENSYATGAVSGSNYVGGLVGENSNSSILNSYATGIVGDEWGTSGYAGGLVGYNRIGSRITNSYATGAVSGNNLLGGLVGRNSDSSIITDSYATGAVSGNSFLGGLVGYNGNGSTIENSYSTGLVTGTSDFGGLVGRSNGTVTNSFWDMDTSGRTSSGGGTGKTTAEMKQLATFSAWNIDDAGGTGLTWRIYDGYTAPLLRSFMTAATATGSVTGGAMVYNGTTSVTGGSYTWTTAVDTSKIYGTAFYTASSKNVGTRAFSLGGIYSNQQGYDITRTGGTVIITPKSLTAAYTGTNKVYDATTAATVTGSSTDIIAGDTVTFSQTAAFADKNAGTGKTINVSGIALSGADAANYNLTGTTATTTADITARSLTAAYSGTNKVYDATTAATVTGSSTGIIAGDTVTFSQTAAFADKNVGTGKTITVSGIALSGTDAANYSLANTAATISADITAAPLTVTANNDSKSYNGTAYFGGNGVTFAGFAIGETSAVLGGTLTYGGTSQGAINAGTYSIDPRGLLTSGNYALSFVSGALTITDSNQRDLYSELMSTEETTFIPQTAGSTTLAGLAAAILVKDKTEGK